MHTVSFFVLSFCIVFYGQHSFYVFLCPFCYGRLIYFIHNKLIISKKCEFWQNCCGNFKCRNKKPNHTSSTWILFRPVSSNIFENETQKLFGMNFLLIEIENRIQTRSHTHTMHTFRAYCIARGLPRSKNSEYDRIC